MTSRKTVLVLGGSSDIGRAAARAFAKAGYDVGLAGRDATALEPDAADLRARYHVEVGLYKFDVLDTGSFDGFVAGLPVLPDVVISIVGLLGVQQDAESDLAHATTIMRSNYEGPSLILGLFAEKFLSRGNGTIVGVSSVGSAVGDISRRNLSRSRTAMRNGGVSCLLRSTACYGSTAPNVPVRARSTSSMAPVFITAPGAVSRCFLRRPNSIVAPDGRVFGRRSMKRLRPRPTVASS